MESENTSEKKPSMEQDMKQEQNIYWGNVVWMFSVHVASLYTLSVLHKMKSNTIIWGVICYYVSGLGITAGVHRLWSHRTYKAKLPLRIFLALCHTMSFQNTIFDLVRDHRVHHKHSDTDADPHNSQRGFFFCHIGWLLMKKNPMVVQKCRSIDLSDIFEDQVVMFQRKHALPSLWFVGFILPTAIPLIWGESLALSILMCVFRYCFTLNCTLMVNSVTHMWGQRPYDKNIQPVENFFVSLLSAGEGFHNYHHAFPYDYRASEAKHASMTTSFIDLMAFIGLASHRRTASPEVVAARMKRTGE